MTCSEQFNAELVVNEKETSASLGGAKAGPKFTLGSTGNPTEAIARSARVAWRLDRDILPPQILLKFLEYVTKNDEVFQKYFFQKLPTTLLWL